MTRMEILAELKGDREVSAAACARAVAQGRTEAAILYAERYTAADEAITVHLKEWEDDLLRKAPSMVP